MSALAGDLPQATTGSPTLAERLARLAAERVERRSVAEVRIGLTYTAVQLDDGGTGVALTFLDGWQRGVPILSERQPLAGRPAAELLAGLRSEQPVEAALGLACVNALLNRPGLQVTEGDVLEELGLKAADRVAMVGHFQPLVPRLRPRVGRLYIFERQRSNDEDLLPAAEALEVLPGCDVALITATAILNHTIDDLLTAAARCREVVLLGASTPLLPAAFAGTPVSRLSGVFVDDRPALLRTVSEGGGMQRFKRFVRKVNLSLGPTD